MALVNVSLTKPSWKRSCVAGSTLLPFLRNPLFNFFGVKLLVPLFIVSRISFAGPRSSYS